MYVCLSWQKSLFLQRNNNIQICKHVYLLYEKKNVIQHYGIEIVYELAVGGSNTTH